CPFPLPSSLSIVSVSMMLPLPSPPRLQRTQIVHTLGRLRNRRHRERERNHPEAFGLPGAQHPQPDQLEQREKRHDDLGARRLGREQARERHLLHDGEPREYPLDGLTDRDLLPRHLVHRRRPEPSHHFTQRVEQVAEARIPYRGLRRLAWRRWLERFGI